MTEEEWMACARPYKMLDFLRDKASDRRLRLFACACCRRIWPLMINERTRKVVELAEQFADGLASKEDRLAARATFCDGYMPTEPNHATRLAWLAARATTTDRGDDAVQDSSRYINRRAVRRVSRFPAHPL